MTLLPVRLLICGSRDWPDPEIIRFTLSTISISRIQLLIHGAARGADTMAEEQALSLGLSKHLILAVHAEWKKYGRAAGFVRNEDMLKFLKQGPTGVLRACIGFPLSNKGGAIHMLGLCQKAGIPFKAVRRQGYEEAQIELWVKETLCSQKTQSQAL